MKRSVQALKNLWDVSIGRTLVFVLVGIIRIYQLTLSPRIGQVCRYYPSCSHYGAESITTHGAFKGVILTGFRIIRCNPWSQGGIDKVPARGQWISQQSKVIESSTTDTEQEIAA